MQRLLPLHFFWVLGWISDVDVLANLKELYKAVDHAFAEVQKQFPAEVSCGNGCADCCHAVFDVSLVEAVMVTAAYDTLETHIQQKIIAEIPKALEEYQALDTNDQASMAKARIRCPLLDEHDRCYLYAARPVNCRSYGVPTVISGAGHVCGFSGFEQGKQYPTVNLEQLQKILYEFSSSISDEEVANKRYSIANVLAELEDFRSYLK